MTTRTFDDIVLEGCLKAGDEGVVPRVRGYFNDWLQRQARSWPWPSLTLPWRGTMQPGQFAILSSNGIPDIGISRVLDNCWLYTADRTRRYRLRVQQVENDIVSEPMDPAPGVPTKLFVQKSTVESEWAFVLPVYLDASYILTMPVVIVPERLSEGATELPWYPEDDTCIQACMMEALLYKNGPDDPSYRAALEVLANMVQADRVRHGTTISQGDVWPMDRTVFK